MSKGIGHRTLKVPGPWNVTGLQVLLHHHDFSKLTLFPYALTKAFIPSLQAHTLNYAKACVCPTLQTLLVVSFACGLLCTAGCHFVRHEAITWADLQRWSRSIWCLYFFFFLCVEFFLDFIFCFIFSSPVPTSSTLVLCLLKKMTTVSQFVSELEHLMNISCLGDLSCSHFCHRICGILCAIICY